MTTWLVTGGAGYIGSHVVEQLRASGRNVVVFDDFSAGLEQRLFPGVPVIRASVLDRAALERAFGDFSVDGVVHLAARKAAGESVDIPLYYYRENIDGVLTVLEAMNARNVRRMVYSSSAAVYGTPPVNPVSEDAPLRPESPYGETKVAGEWFAAASGVAWQLSWVALRYFNVAGAGRDTLGDNSVNNLIPMTFRALDENRRPQIFGGDYPTPDGTCVRDYIHVSDLARAHVAAAQRAEGGRAADVYNVGRGVGSSVREVMDAVLAATRSAVRPEVVARRAGDPPATFASTDRIAAELRWSASLGLDEMVRSAWSAWTAARDGARSVR